MKNFKYILYVFVLIGLTACSAEDGTDGIDGINGIDGTEGSQGPAGEDGNANVISVLFEDQTVTTGTNTFIIPELTQEIYDTGIIYGYVTVAGNDFWEVMPLSFGGTIILEIDRIRVGELDIKTTFDQSNLRFRFVLIPATATSGRIDFTDYDQVATYYNLD
jgi:hypothetical protein